MNILYVGRYNNEKILSGPEKVAKRVFDSVSENEHTIFMEYFFDGMKYGLLKKIFGMEITRTANNCEIIRAGILVLLYQLVKLRPEIIHIITFERFAFICFIYKLFFSVKIVYNVHGLVVHENKYYVKQGKFHNLKDNFVEKIIIKKADILLVLSENIKILLEKYFGTSKNIRFIKNGVDSEFGNVYRKYNAESVTPLKIVFISDITRKEKGFDFLKSAIEKIDFGIELYIIDKKESKIVFENFFIKVFCADKMTPLELADFLSDKDVFVSASSYEPFSISAVEAMASGMIPVLTIETGASELIKDGKNGFTLKYGDAFKLNKLLKKLNSDFVLRKSLSQEAMKIIDILNWEKITSEYRNIYKSLKL